MLSNGSTGDVSAWGHALHEQVRTLLLDDSPFDRERIKRLCRKAGLPLIVDEVQDIAELRNALHTRKYDLVLVDYHLSGADGLDALKDVLNSPFNQHAAKIMISGSDNTDLVRKSLEVGCHDFLAKDMLTKDDVKKSVEWSLIHARREQQTDVVDLKGTLETSLKSTVADVLRSELQSHTQASVTEQDPVVSKMFLSMQDEHLAQERLNALLVQCEGNADAAQENPPL